MATGMVHSPGAEEPPVLRSIHLGDFLARIRGEMGWSYFVPLAMIVCLLGLLVRLNARGRRGDALQAKRLVLAPRNLRCAIAVRVRCGVVTNRAAIDVDMASCTCAEIWAQVAQWHAALPEGVRLVVRGSR